MSKDDLPGKDTSLAVNDPWIRLAAAVLLKAFDDIDRAEDRRALDALLWLAIDPIPRTIVDVLGIDIDPLVGVSRKSWRKKLWQRTNTY